MITSQSQKPNYLDVPVALIVYRRPELTSRILERISAVRPKKLFVIADGPRANIRGELERVRRTREMFETLSWDCEVVKIWSDRNMGLRRRVISGLDQVFQQVDKAIILEDDCAANSTFFTFCEAILQRYEKNDAVGMVSGNNFAPRELPAQSYYFSAHANIWGWATWRATWLRFREWLVETEQTGLDDEAVIRAIPDRLSKFTFKRLLAQKHELDSWAIDFSCFFYLNGLASAVPSQNLVTNVGFGVESTHTKFESWVDLVAEDELKFPLVHPSFVTIDVGEMKRESRLKCVRSIAFLLIHPIDAVGRILRFLRQRRDI